MDEKKKTSISDFIFSVILIGGIIGGIYYYGSINKKEIILTNVTTRDITFFESKYLLGGVWFNRDRLSILSDGLTIFKNSLFSGEETVQLPYNKIKKVIFEEGFGIFEITIESEGRIFNDKYNFYIGDKGNFTIIKDNIRNHGGDKITIIENRTFMNRIFNREKKKPLSKY